MDDQKLSWGGSLCSLDSERRLLTVNISLLLPNSAMSGEEENLPVQSEAVWCPHMVYAQQMRVIISPFQRNLMDVNRKYPWKSYLIIGIAEMSIENLPTRQTNVANYLCFCGNSA